MQRRRVLTGLIAGASLLAGCSSTDGSGGNATQSANGSDTTAGNESTATTVATTMTETARETATRTRTRTQTRTATATPTPTETATARPTSATTAAETAAMATTMQSMQMDLSDRETYSSDSYPYTIEYPTEWRVDETDPTEVSFTSPATPGELTIYISEDAPSSVTLEQATDQFLSGYQQSAGESDLEHETLDRREVTLPNEYDAIYLDLRLSSADVAMRIRQNAVLTLVGDTLYTAAITLPEPAYSSSVDQQTEEMLLSLTVSEEASVSV